MTTEVWLHYKRNEGAENVAKVIEKSEKMEITKFWQTNRGRGIKEKGLSSHKSKMVSTSFSNNSTDTFGYSSKSKATLVEPVSAPEERKPHHHHGRSTKVSIQTFFQEEQKVTLPEVKVPVQ